MCNRKTYKRLCEIEKKKNYGITLIETEKIVKPNIILSSGDIITQDTGHFWFLKWGSHLPKNVFKKCVLFASVKAS